MGYDITTHHKSGDEEADYFHVNGFKMDMLISAMQAAQVLDLTLKDVKWSGFIQLPDESKENYYARCDVVNNPIRAMRSNDNCLVPIRKFTSNNGWLVLPKECTIIASGLDKVQSFIHKDYDGIHIVLENHNWMQLVKKFSEYCLYATKYGGFEVW